MSSLRFSEKALDKFIDLQLMAAFEANRPQPPQHRYRDSFDYQSDLSEWCRDQSRWIDSERGNARRALLAHLLEAEGKDFRKALMWELIREFHGEDAFIRALPESPSDKREILNQWLQAEGLPGVEEIDELVNAYPQLERGRVVSWRYHTDRPDVWVEVGLDVAFVYHPDDVVLSAAERQRLLIEARRAYEARHG